MITDKYIDLQKAIDASFLLPLGSDACARAVDNLVALCAATPGLFEFHNKILDLRIGCSRLHGSYRSHKQLHGKEA